MFIDAPNDKVVFVNNNDKRIDLLKDIDGIFGEHEFAGRPLNLTAIACINKPMIAWVYGDKIIRREGADNFFQKHLHLGVFPMAPFPGNDHSIGPDEWTDQQYLDYGPLLSVIQGKKWVLEPHCVETSSKEIKVNLFKVPGGYALPVTFGGTEKSATVTLRNIPNLDKLDITVIHPGKDAEVPVTSKYKNGILELDVPLHRACGMVKLLIQ